MVSPRPKKSLGQNFLMHPQIAERIVRAANLPKNTHVLEIGSGTGMLTRTLLTAGHSVTAVEADAELIPKLEEMFASEIKSKKLRLRHADIRMFDISSLPKPYALVANIPYYITGEIIRMFLTAKRKPVSMTLLVQKEVAERIARQKRESLLSLSVKAHGNPKYCFTVPKGAFRPAPKVNSAVLAIRDINPKAFKSSGDESAFFNALRTGFAHKRKLLMGNLSSHFPSEAVSAAFEAADIPKKARSEDLSLDDWRRLVGELEK